MLLAVVVSLFHSHTVETVGDCYVAASGIPEPRRDHAASIVRFARDCINCMRKVATSLELSLGYVYLEVTSFFVNTSFLVE